jgi:hypothetical protein
MVGRSVYVQPLPRDLDDSKLPRGHADLKTRIIAAVNNIDAPKFTLVWQQLENRIDACRVTRSAHIESLWLSKVIFQFSCGCEQFR